MAYAKTLSDGISLTLMEGCPPSLESDLCGEGAGFRFMADAKTLSYGISLTLMEGCPPSLESDLCGEGAGFRFKARDAKTLSDRI